jgi:hypothetical protein
MERQVDPFSPLISRPHRAQPTILSANTENHADVTLPDDATIYIYGYGKSLSSQTLEWRGRNAIHQSHLWQRDELLQLIT